MFNIWRDGDMDFVRTFSYWSLVFSHFTQMFGKSCVILLYYCIFRNTYTSLKLPSSSHHHSVKKSWHYFHNKHPYERIQTQLHTILLNILPCCNNPSWAISKEKSVSQTNNFRISWKWESKINMKTKLHTLTSLAHTHTHNYAKLLHNTTTSTITHATNTRITRPCPHHIIIAHDILSIWSKFNEFEFSKQTHTKGLEHGSDKILQSHPQPPLHYYHHQQPPLNTTQTYHPPKH